MARASFTASLISHLNGEVTSVARLLRIVRRDGVAVTLAETDADIVFNSETYLSQAGFDATAIAASEGFRVDTAEFNAFIDSNSLGGITEEDLRIGRYIGASYTLYLVNWQDPDNDNGILRAGRIGDILRGQSGKLVIEFDSEVGRLDVEGGEVYSPTCRADLGDRRCKVPIDPPEVTTETAYEVGNFVKVRNANNDGDQGDFENVIYECTTAGTTAATTPTYSRTPGDTTTDGTAVFTTFTAWTRDGVINGVQTSGGTFTATIDEPRSTDDTWFVFGVITFETGQNQGQSREIKAWTSATGTIETYLPFPFVPADTDVFRIYPGCDKTRTHCTAKFLLAGSTDFNDGNIFNMRAEPDLPGPDYVFTYPDAQ